MHPLETKPIRPTKNIIICVIAHFFVSTDGFFALVCYNQPVALAAYFRALISFELENVDACNISLSFMMPTKWILMKKPTLTVIAHRHSEIDKIG